MPNTEFSNYQKGKTLIPEEIITKHIYDIDFTEIFNIFQQIKEKEKSFFNDFIKLYQEILEQRGVDSENLVKYNKPVLIFPNLSYVYTKSLFYKLLTIRPVLVPLLLNYHFYTFPNDRKYFVKLVEFELINILEKHIPSSFKKKLIIKKTVKWVENKQAELKEEYHIFNIFSIEKHNALKRLFAAYSNINIKNENIPYLELSDDNDLIELSSHFLAYNESNDVYGIERKKFIWNGHFSELAFLIYSIINYEKNGQKVFKQMNIPDFVECTFFHGTKGIIVSETTKRYINKFLSGNYPVNTKLHNEITSNWLTF